MYDPDEILHRETNVYNTQVDEIVGGADPSPEYDRCYRGESSLYTRE
jgi:hypothetical protein